VPARAGRESPLEREIDRRKNMQSEITVYSILGHLQLFLASTAQLELNLWPGSFYAGVPHVD
jgi:hypothetical protein